MKYIQISKYRIKLVCALAILLLFCITFFQKSESRLKILSAKNQSNLSVDTNTKISQNKRFLIIQKTEELYKIGQRQFHDNLYIEAEKSLYLALRTISGKNFYNHIFQTPNNRSKKSYFSFLGLIKFESSKSSTPSYSVEKINGSLDKIYIQKINDLALGKDPYKNDFNSFEEYLIKSNQNDLHASEIKILKLLQQVLASQNQSSKIEESLEIAEVTRFLESKRIEPSISYSLNNSFIGGQINDNRLQKQITSSRLKIKDIKKIAQTQNSTLVYYSIVSSKNILVWVINPSGDINYRNLNIQSISNSLDIFVHSTLNATASFVDSKDDSKKLSREFQNLKLRQEAPTDLKSISRDRVVDKFRQQELLKQLYNLLINPINDLLPSNLAESVIFIPQGELFLVPFAALTAPNGQYLIERFPIRLANNLHALLNVRPPSNRFVTGEEILIIGNPTNWKLEELPGAEAEAKSIADMTRSLPLLNNNAIPETVKRRIQNAKIIHFATHGILYTEPLQDILLMVHEFRDDESPIVIMYQGNGNSTLPVKKFEYSLWLDSDTTGRWHVIRTSGTLPGKIALTDDFLTSQEILNMNLNADLVVLSACSTAKGILSSENTMLGLPMAFGLAGVPNVIASLWAVPDESTQILMTKFYKDLQKQSLKGELRNEAFALREAMMQVKVDSRYKDPIYWAGFLYITISQ